MKVMFIQKTIIFLYIFCNCFIVYAESIEEYCRKIVGDSYSLMETCIQQEREARSKIQMRSTDKKIEKYCQSIVGESYSLVETCIEQEEGAKNRLGY